MRQLSFLGFIKFLTEDSDVSIKSLLLTFRDVVKSSL